MVGGLGVRVTLRYAKDPASPRRIAVRALALPRQPRGDRARGEVLAEVRRRTRRGGRARDRRRRPARPPRPGSAARGRARRGPRSWRPSAARSPTAAAAASRHEPGPARLPLPLASATARSDARSAQGAEDIESIGIACAAGQGCHSCWPDLRELLDEEREPAAGPAAAGRGRPRDPPARRRRGDRAPAVAGAGRRRSAASSATRRRRAPRDRRRSLPDALASEIGADRAGPTRPARDDRGGAPRRAAPPRGDRARGSRRPVRTFSRGGAPPPIYSPSSHPRPPCPTPRRRPRSPSPRRTRCSPSCASIAAGRVADTARLQELGGRAPRESRAAPTPRRTARTSTRLRAEVEERARRIDGYTRELSELGVSLQDPARGLVDFPSERAGPRRSTSAGCSARPRSRTGTASTSRSTTAAPSMLRSARRRRSGRRGTRPRDRGRWRARTGGRCATAWSSWWARATPRRARCAPPRGRPRRGVVCAGPVLPPVLQTAGLAAATGGDRPRDRDAGTAAPRRRSTSRARRRARAGAAAPTRSSPRRLFASPLDARRRGGRALRGARIAARASWSRPRAPTAAPKAYAAQHRSTPGSPRARRPPCTPHRRRRAPSAPAAGRAVTEPAARPPFDTHVVICQGTSCTERGPGAAGPRAARRAVRGGPPGDACA